MVRIIRTFTYFCLNYILILAKMELYKRMKFLPNRKFGVPKLDKLFLRFRTETEEKHDNGTIFLEMFNTTITMRQYYIGVYTLIFVAIIVLIFVRNTAFAFCGQNCAKQIHRKSVHAVLYTDIGFFHNNPSGKKCV